MCPARRNLDNLRGRRAVRLQVTTTIQIDPRSMQPLHGERTPPAGAGRDWRIALPQHAVAAGKHW